MRESSEIKPKGNIMIIRKTITDTQAQAAIEAGEFESSILGMSEAVVLVLTQSWCPQWTALKYSLDGLGNGPDDFNMAILSFEYDLSPLYDAFMNFKENTYRNWEVPYLRIYRNGLFIADGNSIPAGRIVEKIRSVMP